MKITTFKYCLSNGIKSLKSNVTTTIASSMAVSISIFLMGIFFLYGMAIQGAIFSIFQANERYAIDIAKIVKVIKFIVCIGLPLISVAIVSNVIKLSIFSKKEEIKTMKLVGATDGLICLPFMVEGLLIGIIGASLCVLIVFAIYKVICMGVGEFIGDLQSIYPICNMKKMVLILELYGMMLGVLGSIAALWKNLRY